MPKSSRPRRHRRPARSASANIGRWPGIRGESLPTIPDEPVLRVLVDKHPAYRLLVEYLDRFKVEAAVCHRQLAPSVRTAMSRWEPTWEPNVERQTDGPWRAAARVRAAVSVERRPPGEASATPRPFSMLLAWVLMTLDNVAAARTPDVRAVAGDIVRHRNALTMEDVLRWSYVPRVVIGLLDVRLGEVAVRRAQANAVRQYRQRQAVERDEDLPAPTSSDLSRREEARGWTRLGLDKLSTKSSVQEFWFLVFQPLLDRLLGPQPRASWRRACDDASRLVNARYRDLWEHHPDRLRKRYSYTPRLSDRRQ